MTVSPDDVALAAVLGAVYLAALWLRYQDRAADRRATATQATANRKHALAAAAIRNGGGS
jgi:hypothetical protein